MKLKTAPFLVFSTVLFLITIAAYLSSRNAFIYPDSFVYDAIVRSGWQNSFTLNGFQFSPDHFTILKPFSSLYTSFVLHSGIPAIIFNSIWAIGGSILLYHSVYTRQLKKSPLLNGLLNIFLFLFTNGILLYWISRAGVEYFAFFCVSLLIWLLHGKSKYVHYILAAFIIFLRTEFLFILPFLTFRKKDKKGSNTIWFLLIAISTIILGGVSVANNALLQFITHIFVPLAVSYCLAFLIEYELPEKVLFKYGKLVGNGLIILTVAALALVTLNRFGEFGLSLSNILFILPVMAFAQLIILGLFFAKNHEFSKKSLHYLASALLLSTAYVLTAPDSFRYFIFIMPSIIIVIGQFLIAPEPKERILELGVFALQLVLMLIFIPFSLLASNYWVNRYIPIIHEESVIFSSTPVISVYLEKETRDICGITELTNTGYYLIDGFAKYRCNDSISELEEQLNTKARKVQTVYETGVVNLDRFTANGDQTTIYYYSPNKLQ